MKSHHGGAGPADATPAAMPVTSPTAWPVVAAVSLAMLSVSIEISLSAVALPLISDTLGVSPPTTAWVVLAYTLPTAALAIPLGRLVDRIDHRRTFLFAVAGVGTTTVLAAVAPTFPILLAARTLQGIAGAAVAALYLPIVARAVAPHRRGTAIGAVATVMPLGAMAGTAIGGIAVETLGWRALFLLKLPVVVAALLLGGRIAASDRSTWGPVRSRPGLILAEVVLAGGAVTTLLAGVDRVADQPLVTAAAAVLAVGLGIAWTRLPDVRPLAALARRPLLGLPLLTLACGSTLLALTAYLMPFYVTDVLGWPPAALTAVLLTSIGATAVAATAGGLLTDRFGAGTVLLAGLGLTVLGTVGLATLGDGAGLGDVSWRIALVGLGQGLFNGPVNAAVLAAAPAGSAGAAGGLAITARTIGFGVGPAAAAAAWTAASGGLDGFHAGLVTIISLQVCAMACAVAWQVHRRR